MTKDYLDANIQAHPMLIKSECLPNISKRELFEATRIISGVEVDELFQLIKWRRELDKILS